MKGLITFLSVILSLSQLSSQCTVDLGPDQTVCVNLDVPVEFIGDDLNISGGLEPYTYSWETTHVLGSLIFTASDFLSDTSIANPQLIDLGLSPLDFTLTVTDANGTVCSASKTVNICHREITLEDLIRNIVQGDSVLIYPGTSSSCGPFTVEWSPDYNISDVNALQPTVWPDSTTFYTPVLTDSLGCVIEGFPFQIFVSGLNTQNQNTLNQKLKIFPNPAMGQVSVRFEGLKHGILRVYAISGQLVHSEIMVQEQIQTDLDHLPKGMYFVQLETEEGLATKKLVLE